MVEMALDHLKDRQVIDLDEERKATMVSNLLVVLCLLFFNYNAFDILLRDILEFPQDEHGFVKARYVLIFWFASTLLAGCLAWWLARGRRAHY